MSIQSSSNSRSATSRCRMSRLARPDVWLKFPFVIKTRNIHCDELPPFSAGRKSFRPGRQHWAQRCFSRLPCALSGLAHRCRTLSDVSLVFHLCFNVSGWRTCTFRNAAFRGRERMYMRAGMYAMHASISIRARVLLTQQLCPAGSGMHRWTFERRARCSFFQPI